MVGNFSYDLWWSHENFEVSGNVVIHLISYRNFRISWKWRAPNSSDISNTRERVSSGYPALRKRERHLCCGPNRCKPPAQTGFGSHVTHSFPQRGRSAWLDEAKNLCIGGYVYVGFDKLWNRKFLIGTSELHPSAQMLRIKHLNVSCFWSS